MSQDNTSPLNLPQDPENNLNLFLKILPFQCFTYLELDTKKSPGFWPGAPNNFKSTAKGVKYV